MNYHTANLRSYLLSPSGLSQKSKVTKALAACSQKSRRPKAHCPLGQIVYHTPSDILLDRKSQK